MDVLHVSGMRAYTEQKRYHRVLPQTENQTLKSAAYDRYTVSEKQEMKPEQIQTAEQVAEALRKQYPGVTFTFGEIGDRPEDLAQLAVSAGKGMDLVISPEILDWMAQGGAAWQEGSEMIGKTIYELMRRADTDAYNSGAVIAEDGETTLWSTSWEDEKSEMEQDLEYMKNMLDHLDEIREKNAEQQKKLKLQQKKKLNYHVGIDMARIAKGTTGSDVRSVISSLYANRQKIAVSTTYSKKEVQMALAQIDHVIGCARTKIRKLREEDQMKQRVEKAKRDHEEKLRRELARELKERQRSRKAKERARIFERLPDLPGLRDVEEQREKQMEAVTAFVGSMAETVPAVPMAGAELAGGTTVSVPMEGGGSVDVSIVPMA